MDRTVEYQSYLLGDNKRIPLKEMFYDKINNDLDNLNSQITSKITYKSLIVFEDKIRKMRENNNLDRISLKSNLDEKLHFEGIKNIVNLKFNKLNRKIRKLKDQKSSLDLELIPEKPTNFKSYKQDTLLLEENKKILKEKSYEITRQRLLKIDKLQKAIGETLEIQDERIDAIIDVTGTTGKILEEANSYDDFNSGSFARRSSFIVIICLSILLVFLYFFYK